MSRCPLICLIVLWTAGQDKGCVAIAHGRKKRRIEVGFDLHGATTMGSSARKGDTSAFACAPNPAHALGQRATIAGMARAARPWIVSHHDPIEEHASNRWPVSGNVPPGHMLRRMRMVRLSDGRVVLHNAVPLQDEAMRRVEASGAPAFLVVSSAFHRLDIHAFKARFPGLKLVCPAPVRDRVAKVAEVDGDLSLLPRNPALRDESLECVKRGEAGRYARRVCSGPPRFRGQRLLAIERPALYACIHGRLERAKAHDGSDNGRGDW